MKDQWVKKWYMYTMKYSSVIKKNEILPIVTTWIDLKGIMLSEINQDRERKMLYDFTYMWNLKNKINEQAKQKQTHSYRE